MESHPLLTISFALRCVIVWIAISLSSNADGFSIGVEGYSHKPHFYIENGHLSGVSGDIINAFSKASGIKFQIKSLPVKRLQVALENGEIAFRYPDNPNWYADGKRDQPYQYSIAVTSAVAGVTVRKDLLGKGRLEVLGIPMGYNPIEYHALERQGKLTIVEAPDLNGLIRMALVGRIDGVYGNPFWITQLAKDINTTGQPLVFDPSLPHSRHDFQLSTLGYPSIILQFNEWIIENETLIGTIHERYGVGADQRKVQGKSTNLPGANR